MRPLGLSSSFPHCINSRTGSYSVDTLTGTGIGPISHEESSEDGAGRRKLEGMKGSGNVKPSIRLGLDATSGGRAGGMHLPCRYRSYLEDVTGQLQSLSIVMTEQLFWQRSRCILLYLYT